MLWEGSGCGDLRFCGWPMSNQTRSLVRGEVKGLWMPLLGCFGGDCRRGRGGAVGISLRGVPVGSVRAETKSRCRVLPVSRSMESRSPASGVKLGAELLLLVDFWTQVSRAPLPWRSFLEALWLAKACSPLLELRAARGYGNRSGDDEVVSGSEDSL